jgi:ABC-2 type transport system ATP-binding protein
MFPAGSRNAADEISGDDVRSGTTPTLVLAAGLGVRHGGRWLVRSASFRMDASLPGTAALGVLATEPAAATALIDLLSWRARPGYGELRVLGADLAEAGGRAAVRRRVGVARRTAPLRPAIRVRGLVERAARRARVPARDRRLLAAAILDRMSLTPWADVQLRAAPDVIGRRAKLAAAAVHEPALVLIDGLLDELRPRDAAALADCIREVARDAPVIAAGCDAPALSLACDEMITLAGGILVSA